ncbi:hypothetical protein BDY19DRAFT_227558 [Irpex rosettiformis]|uniref:Uncharacterized protein n=1 Tax=Irpex rosettiformis TaxID=378272 RepID=A0ACB8U0X4_9APHY|nr:hypothetical protein BDY19DRAFT_227558 [Irpex rosettiformis]
MSSTAKICPPPVYTDECEVCHLCEDDFDEEEDECPAEWKLLKCSVCKNRFYCSTACQKQDWKRHKVDCTKLPSEPLELPNITIPLEILDAEAERVREVLKSALKEIEAAEEANGKKSIGPEKVKQLDSVKNLAKYTLSDAVARPNTYSLPSLTHLFASVSRFLLLRHIARERQNSGTDEAFAASLEPLEKHFDNYSAHSPPGFARLLGPKVTRLPGELGLAEYIMLLQLMLVYMFTVVADKPEGQRWSVLQAVMTRVCQ